MSSRFLSVLSFLTVLPTRKPEFSLEDVAKNMFLFPIIGAALGLLLGGAAYGLSFLVEPLIVGLLITGAYVGLTGAHHTDALCDFADGIMTKGSKENIAKAMRDHAVGSGGVVVLVLYLVGMIIGISMMKGYAVFEAILLSEIIAKFSMVLQAALGRSAWDGLSLPFTKEMKSKTKFFVTCVFTIIPVAIIGGAMGAYALSISTAVSLVILIFANKILGGISGDVLGFTNEISRLSSILVFASA